MDDRSATGAHQRLVSTPAETATPSEPPAFQVAERELIIEIYPRGCDWWIGTRAQLQAEGVIPADFEWPQGLAGKSWTAGNLEYWLYRRRPDGHKGPKSSCLEVDNWACRRTWAAHGRDGFANARIYEKRVALAEELWALTPAADQQLSRYWAAHKDKSFQAFKAIFLPQPKKPQPKKRGRPSKAKATAKGAGVGVGHWLQIDTAPLVLRPPSA
jgi:hypothetical protein